jgi:adenylate cyclase
MLAVLPFRNLSGDASQEYLSDGITEELIAHLGRLNPAKLGVISTRSVMRLKNKTDDLPSISDQLGVGLVLEGSVRQMDGRIAVTAQLVRVSDRTHLWSETYETLTSDALYRTVSRGVAKALAIRLLPADEAALARALTTNTAAYEAHLAGLYQWNRGTKESFQAALESFRRAGDLDPAYPLAHIGLAKCYFELGEYRFVPRDEAMAKAREHIAIALKLDDTIPEVHALAAAVLESSDPTATGIDEGYRKAIQLTPSDARVRRLDPHSASAHSHAAAVYFATGDFRHSWEESERALAFDPNYPFALQIQGRLYLREGKTESAIAQLQKAVAASGRTPKYLYALARAYLAAGSLEPARQLLAELKEQARLAYVPPEYLDRLSQALTR